MLIRFKLLSIIFFYPVCPLMFEGLKTLGRHKEYKHKQDVDLMYHSVLERI